MDLIKKDKQTLRTQSKRVALPHLARTATLFRFFRLAFELPDRQDAVTVRGFDRSASVFLQKNLHLFR